MRRLGLPALFGVLLASACDRVAEPAAAESSVPAAAPALRADTLESGCALWSWLDLTLAKNDPALKAARAQVMNPAATNGLELARTAGIDIEKQARAVTLCELEGDAPARVFVFDVDRPAELLDRIASAASNAGREESPHGPIVHAGPSWVGRSSAGLVWSDSRAGLERALAGRLPKHEAARDRLLAVRLSGARAAKSFATLAKAVQADPTALQSATLSVGKDGASSELRIATRTVEGATDLLAGVDSAFREVRENAGAQNIPGAEDVTVEADGAGVVVRARTPLRDFLLLLTRVARKSAPKPHAHP